MSTTLFEMDAEVKQAIGTDESLEAYYKSTAFENYLRAKNVWAHVQLCYSGAVILRHPKIADGLVEAINLTRSAMMACLEDACNTPEHKAAFGW